MSVILGYQTEDKIIIAGDRRGCNIDGIVISEETQKVVSVNKHLCFASAGNAVIQSVIMKEMQTLDSDNLYIEDIENIVCNFYQNAKEKDIPSIYMLPSYLIIAGVNKNGDVGIYSIIHNKGNENKKYVPMIIFNPPDMTNNECAVIMANNIKRYNLLFPQKTITQIAKKSIWVNDKCNVWIFDKKKMEGVFK